MFNIYKIDKIRYDFLKQVSNKFFNHVFFLNPLNKMSDFKNLIAIYEKLFSPEATHILKYKSIYSFNKNRSNSILLKGDIQSGKTAMIILTAMLYLSCERDVILILRNKDDDKKQFKQRFHQFVELLKENGYTNKNFQLIDKHDTSPDHACMFLDLYRKENIKNILNKFTNRNSENTVMYIDEADLRNDIKDKEFNEIFQKIGTKIFVSATIQDILVSRWNIIGNDIIPLFKSEKYRGVENINFVSHDDKSQNGLFWTFSNIAGDQDYSKIDESHPKIVLVHIERSLEYMKKLFNHLIKNQIYLDDSRYILLNMKFRNMCVMNYTGNGIKIYHQTLNQEELSKEFKIHSFQNRVADIQTSVKSVLLWMKKNGGKERFPNIIIIAGDMASRGINFACYDETSNWHLTHQILIKSEQSSSANIVQALRILGNHGDNIPLKVYTTEHIKEIILKSYDLSQEIVNAMIDTDHVHYKSEFKEMTTDTICKNIPISLNNIPKKFLARRKLKDALYICEEEQETYRIENAEEILSLINIEEGKWIKRTEISADETIKNRLRRLIDSHSVVVEDENVKGLLFRKINNLIYIKYNK